VAFCAVSNLFGGAGRRRISRVVVAPDFQGVGIGSRLLETVAAHHVSLGQTIRITTSHPAMLAYLQRSPRWRAVHVYPNTRRRKRWIGPKQVKDAAGRCVATFEFTR
jgi:GNAT superfamily N-acetyltransferase